MKLHSYILPIILLFISINSFAQEKKLIHNGHYTNHYDKNYIFKNDSITYYYSPEWLGGKSFSYDGKYYLKEDSIYILVDSVKLKGEYSAKMYRVGFHTRKRKDYLFNIDMDGIMQYNTSYIEGKLDKMFIYFYAKNKIIFTHTSNTYFGDVFQYISKIKPDYILVKYSNSKLKYLIPKGFNEFNLHITPLPPEALPRSPMNFKYHYQIIQDTLILDNDNKFYKTQ